MVSKRLIGIMDKVRSQIKVRGWINTWSYLDKIGFDDLDLTESEIATLKEYL